MEIEKIENVIKDIFNKRTDDIKLIKDKMGNEFIDLKLNKAHLVITKQQAINMQEDFIKAFKNSNER